MKPTLVSTGDSTKEISINASEDGGIVERNVKVDARLISGAKQQPALILVGQLFVFCTTADDYLRAQQEYVDAQLELIQARLDYHRAVETGKDDKEVKELRLAILGLSSVLPPNPIALESIRNEIFMVLNKHLANHPPYKTEGNPYFGTSENLFDFIDRVRDTNTGTYMAYVEAVQANDTKIEKIDSEVLGDVINDVEHAFITTSAFPLPALAAEIMTKMSQVTRNNIGDLISLASYLEGNLYMACEAGLYAIEDTLRPAAEEE